MRYKNLFITSFTQSTKLVFILISLIGTINAFAANSFYCTQTSNYIYLGNTPDQVFAACGQPTSTQQDTVTPTTSVAVIQWIYTTQTSIELLNHNTAIKISGYASPSSTMIVSIANHQVLSISINGSDVTSSNFCNPTQAINVGDSDMQVLKLCSSPGQIQKTMQNIPQASVNRLTWIYQQPNQTGTLIFENSKLISIN